MEMWGVAPVTCGVCFLRVIVSHLLLTKSSTKDKASGSFHTTDAFYARSTHSLP
jgi:hypothetical protein